MNLPRSSDFSRHGSCSMESHRENLKRVFVRTNQVLSDSCLLVWNLTMPFGETCHWGFLSARLQPLAGSQDVIGRNFYSVTLAGNHCFDVLNFHFHFYRVVHHHHQDGVH